MTNRRSIRFIGNMGLIIFLKLFDPLLDLLHLLHQVIGMLFQNLQFLVLAQNLSLRLIWTILSGHAPAPTHAATAAHATATAHAVMVSHIGLGRRP